MRTSGYGMKRVNGIEMWIVFLNGRKVGQWFSEQAAAQQYAALTGR